jgi:hypothetical protein
MTHHIIKTLAVIAMGAMLLDQSASKVCNPDGKCN